MSTPTLNDSAPSPVESAASPPERRLRADARRNRARVLAGAREAFATDGLDAQMDEIARRAGVGVGTVYRHFPTKDALIEALIEAHFGQVTAEAEAAFDERDAWLALSGWFERAVALGAGDRALAEVVAGREDMMHVCATRQAALQEAVGRLIARAQAAGAMRADVDVDDVPAIMCSVMGVARRFDDELAWRRHLSIVLDGLRSAGASSLPAREPRSPGSPAASVEAPASAR